MEMLAVYKLLPPLATGLNAIDGELTGRAKEGWAKGTGPKPPPNEKASSSKIGNSGSGSRMTPYPNLIGSSSSRSSLAFS